MNRKVIFAVASLLAATAMGGTNVLVAGKTDIERSKPLPRVLLIGDSISGGYQQGVKNLLAGKAVVVKNAGNAQHTGTGLKMLDEWLGDGTWDVIHFNWGLWDVAHRNPESKNFGHLDKVDGKITTTPSDYDKNLRELVARLKKSGATLVWASTTPVPDGEPGRIKGDEVKYNAIAAKIMAENNIAIDDLHAEVIRLGRPKTNNVHDTGDLAPKVTDSILAALATSRAGDTEVTLPGRWSVERATTWYAQQPWLVGCNFIPSTAINQLEMWQADTFDPVTIDRELGWAAGIGMNTVRVYLHDLLWQQDSEGFLKRMDQFLGIAEIHHISTLFVLCDSVWNPHPKLGKQPEPKPHVHNSGWVQSPHIEILRDERQHDSLAPYFKGVLGRFKDDRRVLGWDLYNEPGNDGEQDRMTTLEKEAKCLLLLTKMFTWARQVNPSQPLTTGLWSKEWVGPKATALNRFIVANSDVLSFHIYDRIDKTRGRVDSLKPFNRPLLCTEYLARGAGSLFEEHLPFFKQNRIGAYNWGFVAGKIQTQYPWSSWRKTFTAEPDVWHHDILRPDGTPFRQAEVDLFKSLNAGNHHGVSPSSELPAMASVKASVKVLAEIGQGRFVDAHVHFHACKAGELDKAADWMRSNNVQRIINYPLAQSRPKNDAERKQMLANYAKYEGRIARACVIFPDEVNSVEEAVTILTREKQAGAVVFGEHYGSKLNFDDPKNMRLYEACEQVGLPVMFHMDKSQNLDEKGLPRLENVLKTVPNCTLIAHSDWWRNMADGTCDRVLTTYPNLYADISCTVGRSVIGRDKKLARAFFIKHADKLLFGTDSGWWSLGKGKNPAPEFALMDELKLPKEVEDKICRGNAERLFWSGNVTNSLPSGEHVR